MLNGKMGIIPLLCVGFFHLLVLGMKPRSLEGQSFVPCVKGLLELFLVSVSS